MKKGVIFVLAAFLLSAAVPAFAQQNHQHEVACALAAQNCLNVVNILQKRINELNAEIQKGNTKYSAEDMKKLEKNLQENQALLDRIEKRTESNTQEK
jgi:Skp family chaperone for outer membrane proteins